jgi:hypothetical protein
MILNTEQLLEQLGEIESLDPQGQIDALGQVVLGIEEMLN